METIADKRPSPFVEVVSVLFMVFSLFSVLVGGLFLTIYCLYAHWTTRLVAILYLTWIWYDRKTMDHGRYQPGLIKNIREWAVWENVRSYFSAKLIKTADLDPKKAYIFACHPHGVYCFSYFINIFFNPRFYRLYEGVRLFQCTLPINFLIPGWRDYILSIGTVGSSKAAISNALKPGTALALFVGGAREFHHMKRGTMDLVLNSRKGFVKIALTQGASLVPVLGFGENDIFDRVDHPNFSLLHKLAKLAKMAAPLFSGRYVFLPHKVPLVTVVGEPIHVERIETPTQKDIDDLHEIYCQALMNIYEKYKDEYHADRVSAMRFVS
ncbi:2-acylglycerol O-acyltransferase 2 [Boothiomyces sp. JEL0866]|nr:2-acylglycerol O-acyltransferase 2 [Boothiomyces sp. JEL0866]